MPAAGSWAKDFDPRLLGVLGCASELLGHVRTAARGMSTGHGTRGGPWGGPRTAGRGGTRGGPWGGPWERGRPGGPGGWPGGFGGPWARWWAGPGPQGPPGPPRGPKAGRGDVRAAILALLREGPRNGYQIMSDIEERSEGMWRPSPGAVYPALQQLADEGLIAGEESGGRRTFSLTEEGRRYVEENPEMARGSWESMAREQPWEVPGLFAQAARLGASIVQMAHAGTPEQIHAAERLLERTRRSLYQILAEDDDEDPEEPADPEEPEEPEEPAEPGEPR
jgi:DNA-binding PadR family transcriptional regulator